MADVPPQPLTHEVSHEVLTSAQHAEAEAVYRQLLIFRRDGWTSVDISLDSGLGMRPKRLGKRIDIAPDRNSVLAVSI